MHAGPLGKVFSFGLAVAERHHLLGSVRAWRAEQARELLFLKRLVVRNRNRKRPRAELTMTHRLFLLRDDALFLRCLEYCWFLDPWKRYPSETDYRRAFGAADTEPES